MNYESFLKTSLAKYQNADFVRNEVLNAIEIFSDLKPKLGKAEFTDGNKKVLLQLEGNIPIEYKGKTYNTPMCVWILDHHPYQAPLVRVTPTSSMYIRQSNSVDVNGIVCTDYLKKWQHPNSNLLGFLFDLTEVFGRNPPLSSIIPSYAHGSEAEYIAKLKLSNYTQALKTKQDAIGIVNVFPGLKANMQEIPFVDGTRKLVLCLEGTIPVVYRGEIYHTPVSLHLMEQHPYQPPAVYVKPSPGMTMNISRYVDESGKVYTPYLAEWNYPDSDLLSLIQEVTVIFGKTPPLFTNSKTEQTSIKTRNFTSPGQPTSVTVVQPVCSDKGQPTSVTVVQPVCSDNAPGDDTSADTVKLDSGQVLGRVVAGMDELNFGSAEDFDIHCDPCNVESSFVEAEGFCIDCKEYYCKACLKYHRKISATKNHTILLKDKMPKP